MLRAAGGYLSARPADIALTDSTTMGLGLLYNGLDLRAGQEVVTTTHDFFATHEALRLKAARSGATVRQVPLYRDPARASEDEIVESVRRAVGPRTRVVALTWVHSSTGVKLPVRRIARRARPRPGAAARSASTASTGSASRTRPSGDARLRLPRRRLPQVAVRAARHRLRLGPAGSLAGGSRRRSPRSRAARPAAR